MKNIPNKIYLQVDPENEKPETFDELDGITWCVDKINDNDIPYYRHKNSNPVDTEVKQAACGKWQRKKPDKPCYFVHRYKRTDRHPSFFEADIDTEVLCVYNIQDDEFSCTMEEFVDEGEFYIIEK